MHKAMLGLMAWALWSQSGGYSGVEEEQLRKAQMSRWKAVGQSHVEGMPKTTPKEQVRARLSVSEQAWEQYLKGKQALYLGQAVRLEIMAEELSEGAGQLRTPEVRPLLEDLRLRIKALRAALEELSKQTDPASLAESGLLRADLRGMEALAKGLTEAEKLAEPSRRAGEDAERVRIALAAQFDAQAKQNRERAAAVEGERAKWKTYHQDQRERFGLNQKSEEKEEQTCAEKP